MSLINEALKRAQEDKLRNSAPAGGLEQIAPIPVAAGRPVPWLRRAAFALLGCICLGVAAWAAMEWKARAAPRQAVAAVATKLPAAGTAAPARQDEPFLPANPSPVAGPQPDPQVQLALARTSQDVRLYQPTDAPAAAAPQPAGPTPEQLQATKARAEAAGRWLRSAADGPPCPHSTGPAADAAGNPDAPSPAPAPEAAPTADERPKEAPTTTPAQPDKAEPTPGTAPQPRVDPSRYRLSGIMHGPTGAMAIINNCCVGVGQTIDDARVRRIEQYGVELEVGGQVFTVRM